MSKKSRLTTSLLITLFCAGCLSLTDDNNDSDGTETETGETGFVPTDKAEPPNPDTSGWPALGERCDNQPFPCQPPLGCTWDSDTEPFATCKLPEGQ